MAGKVVNLSFVLLSKFVASGQESASKTATKTYRQSVVCHIKQKRNSEIKTKKKTSNIFKYFRPTCPI